MSWLDRDGSSSQDREALAAWHQDRRDTFSEAPVIRCDRCGEQVGHFDDAGMQEWETEVAEVVPVDRRDFGVESHLLVHVACMVATDELA